MIRGALHRLAAAAGHLPVPVLTGLLRAALRGQGAALCLHRVGESRGSRDPVPRMTIPASVLDGLLTALVRATPPNGAPRLTVTFDDGYRSAADYVRERAPRFPGVEWLYFVCPAKTEARAGFRWDLFERTHHDSGSDDFLAFMTDRLDPSWENRREDLRALGDAPGIALATVEECRGLRDLPNVELGNHMNSHFKPTLLADEVFRADLLGSVADFERLFGRGRHLAFPFGTPGIEVNEAHVRIARDAGELVLWGTESRPMGRDERSRKALLPRFTIDGRASARHTLAWMALRAVATWRRRSASR